MALSGLECPVMQWEGDNLKENWRRFKQHAELMFTGPLKSKNEAEKCSYLLIWVGQKGRDIYNTWTGISVDDRKKLQTYYDRFENHDCDFKDPDEMIRDRIVFGTNSLKVREKLISKGAKLTLDKAIEIAISFESSQAQLTAMAPDNVDGSIHLVQKRDKEKGAQDTQHQKYPVPNQPFSKPPKKTKPCRNCGRSHDASARCPARGQTCLYCKKAGHFVEVCQTKARRHQIHTVEGSESAALTSSFEDINFESITIANLTHAGPRSSPDEIFVSIQVSLPQSSYRKTTLKAKLDTGAQGNILPMRLYREMFPHQIERDGKVKPNALSPSNVVLTAYGGSRINHHGIVTIPCSYGDENSTASFYVTDTPGPAILGLPTSTDLNLLKFNCTIQAEHLYTSNASDARSIANPPEQRKEPPPIKDKQDLIAQYPECFNGIGKFQGGYHITLDPSVPPVVHPPRRVPISLRDDIKSELDDMAKNGIITKIEEGEPTSWVNSLVYRRKQNGRLRLCLDPKDLNAAIQREHHVTPTLEEIIPKLMGATVFSIVDAKCGYWNVVLDKESSYLTTFNSPFGRYRFNRMPFGLKMSQDIFQTKIDQTFEGCKGVAGIADDIVVFGKTTEEHDRNMHAMLKRCQETGLKLNPEKCFVKQEKIKFYGVVCGKEGIQPDPSKVSALKQMSSPTSRQELQTFLGLANYMGPFIPNLSSLTAPLRELLKEKYLFQWSLAHQDAFEKVKDSVSNEVTLTYFDPRKEIILQVDASLKGLGAALMQDSKPVAFASKALTDVETRYANIERELLAVVYGCEKFHTYLFGHSFTVHSDHKPLESIHLKHLTAAPPRLQRMLLRLQPYDLVIRYQPGKSMEVADALSRLSPEEKEAIPGMNVEVHGIYPQFSEDMLKRIRDETAADPELNALKEMVHLGWPSTIQQVSALLKPYWPFRDELAVEDGIAMKGHRIIIPPALQREILTRLHSAHQGTEKTKLRARTSVYWRGLNKDIVEITKSCITCQELQPSQQKEPLIPTEVPPRAWHTIGTDIFTLEGSDHLIVADYYSKYPFVRPIPRGQSNSQTVVKIMKQIFSEQGIPKVVRSDNGPHYNSQAFEAFARDFGFQHVTSSPHYPRSNGFIESQVKSVKTILLEAKTQEPDMGLLCLRATPIDHKLPSPAELLLGRPIQDNLPSKIPRDVSNEAVGTRLEERQELQRYYHDRSARHLPELASGQKVTIQDPATLKWKPAEVKERLTTVPRSYMVTTPAGGELRRNRTHIREVPQGNQEISPELGGQIVSHAPSSAAVGIQDTPGNQVSTDPGSYVTRSGRVIKAPERLDI
ncbi:hypothetical protein ACROYT_G026128 [Oculina patagonica]